MDVHLLQYHLFFRLSFLDWIVLYLCQKSVGHIYVSLFLGSCFCFQMYNLLSDLYICPSTDCHAVLIAWPYNKSWNWSDWFLPLTFFQNCFSFYVFLFNFRIMLSIATKILLGFWYNCVKLVYQWGENRHLCNIESSSLCTCCLFICLDLWFFHCVLVFSIQTLYMFCYIYA